MSGAEPGHAGRGHRGSGAPIPLHTIATDRGPKDGGLPSFVDLSPLGKSAHTFAPSAVAARLQVLSHQCLGIVGPQPVQYAYLLEAYMIAEGHLDDFANGCGVKE